MYKYRFTDMQHCLTTLNQLKSVVFTFIDIKNVKISIHVCLCQAVYQHLIILTADFADFVTDLFG